VEIRREKKEKGKKGRFHNGVIVGLMNKEAMGGKEK